VVDDALGERQVVLVDDPERDRLAAEERGSRHGRSVARGRIQDFPCV